MANVKISALPSALSLGLGNNDEIFLAVQDNTTKKITLSDLLSNLNRPVHINSKNSTANDLRVDGSTIDSLLLVSAAQNKIAIGGETIDTESLITVNGDLRVNGSMKESSDTQFPVDNVTPVNNGILTISKTTTALVTVDHSTYTLPAGKKGQWKIIYIGKYYNPTTSVSPRATINITNLVTAGVGVATGPTQVVLNAGATKRPSITLLYESFEYGGTTYQGWVVVSSNDATIIN